MRGNEGGNDGGRAIKEGWTRIDKVRKVKSKENEKEAEEIRREEGGMQ